MGDGVADKCNGNSINGSEVVVMERCIRQLSPPIGYFPGKSALNGADCRGCEYDPVNNKRCPCYEKRVYEFKNTETETVRS